MTRADVLTLLHTHQDGVYTVCLHVLRHPQDAEDAAQEALLKIAAEAAGVREPRAFKSWLYRVTWRTAVDHFRKRATRRRLEEGSVPMSPPALTDAQREAIHEAMAALPDDERLMLVEHYFEKSTIEELGRREGISDVAMGKRLEKARGKLKRGLAGAGILAGASDVAGALESVTPAAAPAGLLASKAALVAAGGAAVGSKSVASIGIVIALILLMVGGGYLLLRREMPTAPLQGGKAFADSTPQLPDSQRKSTPAEQTKDQKGDIRACRNNLALGLASLRSNDAYGFAFQASWDDIRTSPVLDELIRQFLSSAGDNLIPISKSLLADAKSEAMKLLIIVGLGRSENGEAVSLLKGFAADKQGSYHLAAVALNSIGLLRTTEGLQFLKSELRGIREPLLPAVLTAIGRHGTEGLSTLLAEAKSTRFESEVHYQGVPWSFALNRGDILAFVRGKDLFEGLKTILESEENRDLRMGAARALALNLEPDHVDFLAAFVSKDRDSKIRVIHGISGAEYRTEEWESSQPQRRDLADRILADTPYPSGNVELDRALIRLGKVASSRLLDQLFEKFIALYPQSNDPELFWAVGEIVAAYASRPDGKAKILAITESKILSNEQRPLVAWVALQKAPRDVAETLVQPVLEILRTSHPSDQRFENCLQALIVSKINEGTLSTALQEAHDRLSEPADRILLLRESCRRVDPYRGTSVPRSFFETTIRTSHEYESVVYAAHGLLASPEGMAADPALRKRLVDLMKQAVPTPSDGYLPAVVPPVIGDYYSKFGTAADIPWLQNLPSAFPYPASWGDERKSSFRTALTQETSRALDVIRLRN